MVKERNGGNNDRVKGWLGEMVEVGEWGKWWLGEMVEVGEWGIKRM